MAGIALGFAGTAHATPVTLICYGKLIKGGYTMKVGGETAILDMEARTFKPPMYPEFPLTRTSETDLFFGSELPNLSTWGNLDRVSGTLTMNVMIPSERRNLQAGTTAHWLDWLDAKCAPAQKMF
jgi:hypothetical protein